MSRPPRVALVAGTLAPGGAEKQLVYAARALVREGLVVGVFSLTRGEFHEEALKRERLEIRWVGRRSSPPARLLALGRLLLRFRPDVIQSTHSFANLYAAILGRVLGTASVGALRSGLAHSEASNGAWTRWQLSSPDALIVNSAGALDEVRRRRWVSPERVFYVPNVIDCGQADAAAPAPEAPAAVFVGRLVAVKRVDRFLRALAIARREVPRLEGWIVGDGPERGRLERLTAQLGLAAPRVWFAGQRDDVPALIARAQMLVLCSEDEGCPNAVLEAMAARRPVLATPVGDAARLVREGETGFLAEGEDAMARRMVQLARSEGLRRKMGEAARDFVDREHGCDGLAGRLLSVYRAIARLREDRRLSACLSGAFDA